MALQLGRKEKGTPFYVYMVLASMVAALAEPLYDVGFALYFYSQQGMHHTFTAFGIPQPVWAYSGYAVLYAAPAIYINRKLAQGKLDRRGLLPVAGVIFLMSCAFEMIGINAGTYTYWGPHVLRVFQCPPHQHVDLRVRDPGHFLPIGCGRGCLAGRGKNVLHRIEVALDLTWISHQPV